MASAEVVDGQGQVSYRFFEAPETLCASSPCVADLSPGNVLLGFPVAGKRGAMEIELVHVGADEATVYRRSLSRYHDPRGATYTLGIISTSVGGLALTTGSVLLPLGLAKDIDGMTLAGAVNLGAGAALLTLGILAMSGQRAWFRPGSAIHFPVSGN
jgi:hypothetical protein